MKIKTRLVIILLTLSIIPALFIGSLFYKTSMELLERNVLSRISSSSRTMEATLVEFLNSKRARTVDFSTDGFIFETLKAINESNDPEEKTSLGIKLSDYIKTYKITIDPDILALHVLDPSGKIVASTIRDAIGRDISAEPFFTHGLKDSYIQDVSFRERGKRRYIPISAPIKRGRGVYGIIVNEFSVSIIDDILSGKKLKEHGVLQAQLFKEPDFYLVNSAAALIAAGREPGETEGLKGLFPVKSCLEGSKEVHGQWQGVDGKPVFGTSECITVTNGPVWVLIAEEDRDDVTFLELRNLRNVVLLSGVSSAIVIFLTALAVALSISRPLDKLKKGTERIATGDLDYKVGTEERDELGELSRAFDKMTGDLKKVTASRDELTSEIRERIRAEEALLASEEKYRSLVENAPVGVYASKEGRFIYANKALSDMFGFGSPEEMAGTATVDRYVYPLQREALLDELSRKGWVNNFELETVTKYGEARSVLLSGTTQEGGVFTGFILDITERKKAEEIKKEAARSRALAEVSGVLAESGMELVTVLNTTARYIGEKIGMLCVIRLISEDGKVLEPVAIYHKEPASLEKMRELITAYPQSVESGVGSKALKTGRQVLLKSIDEFDDAMLRNLWKGFEDIGVRSAVITPLKSYGKAIGTIGVFRGAAAPFSEDELVFIQDLAGRVALAISNATLFKEVQLELELRRQAEAEIKKYASELERSNEDLQRFAYVASHDLSEPLRMISSFVQLLQKQYASGLDEKANEYIRFAVEGAERMHRMINGLLEYSRVQTQGRPFEHINMEETLVHAEDNLRIALKESGAQITKGPLPNISADPIQMMQLFQNLIGNAIKFKSERPLKITITAEDKKDETVFSVADNGIGIEDRYRDKIFELFARLHGKKYPGTGLGLAICKRIVERHGGRIWVRSEPGAGSIFFFSVPKRSEGKITA